MSDEIQLDSPAACIAELSECNTELATFGAEWGVDAGKYATLEKRYQRAYKAAMRENKGANADERSAIAQEAAEQFLGADEVALMDELAGEVVKHEKTFKALDRRASNAQSILAALRDEARWEQVTPDGRTFGRRAA